MKLYRTPDGIFHGRRGDRKDAVIVEVQTDANGLAEAVNNLVREVLDSVGNDEYITVVERQDPVIERLPAPAIETGIALDEAFQNAPIGQQLDLACIALENARTRIAADNPIPKAPQRGEGRIKANAALAGDDDELFG